MICCLFHQLTENLTKNEKGKISFLGQSLKGSDRNESHAGLVRTVSVC